RGPFQAASPCGSGFCRSTSASAKRSWTGFGIGASRSGRAGGAVEDGAGQCGFVAQDRPCGYVVVPLDQRRDGTGAGDQAFIERPDGILDRRVVGVDQQRRAEIVHRLGMAAEMDLPDMAEGETREIVERIEIVVG